MLEGLFGQFRIVDLSFLEALHQIVWCQIDEVNDIRGIQKWNLAPSHAPTRR